MDINRIIHGDTLTETRKYPDDYIDKVICGDCLEVMKGIPDNTIDIVVTSPPYNIGIDYGTYKDILPWGEYYEWCKRWLIELLRVLKSDGRFCLNHYLSLGQSENRHSPLMELNHIAINNGFKHHGIAIWTDVTLTKRTAWGSWCSASAPYINSPYEGIVFLYKNSWAKLNQGKSTIHKDTFMELCSGVWNMATDHLRLTPATFPVELPSRCLCLLSYENDLILDPFLGSGTTAVACKQLNRRFIGIEINPDYCKIARERLMGTPESLFKGV